MQITKKKKAMRDESMMSNTEDATTTKVESQGAKPSKIQP